MHRGYVKLWRRVFDSDMHRNRTAFILWQWILCHVAYKPSSTLVGNERITLDPGQLVIGRKQLAHELFMSEQEIRTALKFLINNENLTTKSTSKFTLISVTNWERYQAESDVNQDGLTSDLTKQQPAPNQRLTTLKELKKERSKRETLSESLDDMPSGDVVETATPDCPFSEIVSLYNEILPGLPRYTVKSKQAHVFLRARWREDKERQTLEFWRKFFIYVSRCDHLMGKNDRGWTADFVWLVRPTNFAKVMNGNYLNRPSTQSKPKATTEYQLKRQRLREQAKEMLEEAGFGHPFDATARGAGDQVALPIPPLGPVQGGDSLDGRCLDAGLPPVQRDTGRTDRGNGPLCGARPFFPGPGQAPGVRGGIPSPPAQAARGDPAADRNGGYGERGVPGGKGERAAGNTTEQVGGEPVRRATNTDTVQR